MGQLYESPSKLYVCCAPLWPSTSGYKQSVQGRIFETLSAGAKVTVVALNNESAAQPNTRTPPELESVSYSVITNNSARNPIVEFGNLFTRYPRVARIFSTRGLLQGVGEIISTTQPDTIFAESIWAMCAIDRAEWHRVNLIVHDVTELMLRAAMEGERSLLRKLFHWRDLQRCTAFEQDILTDFPGTLTFLTQEDRAHYLSRFKFAPERCLLATNALMATKLRRVVERKLPFLLFPGSVEFHQNFTALEWMAKEVWPLLGGSPTTWPTPAVTVTGRASASRRDYLSGLGMPITWLGEVPYSKLDALYASCLCVISPIKTGTGIKIKNLEAVTKGIPLVATGLSARGINSELCHAAVDNSAMAFSKALNACIRKQWLDLDSH